MIKKLIQFGFLILIGLAFVGSTPSMINAQETQINPEDIEVRKKDDLEKFIEPTLEDLMRTLIKFEGIDIYSQGAINEFAKVFYCDLFTEFLQDDFDWQKVQTAVLKTIYQSADFHPYRYRITGPIQLSRYDFRNNSFPFKDKYGIRGVTTLPMLDQFNPLCNDLNQLGTFPMFYSAILRDPFSMVELKMPEEEARAFAERMDEEGNFQREIYIKFDVEITGNYTGTQLTRSNTAHYFTADLIHAGLYYDRDLTEPLWEKDFTDFSEPGEYFQPLQSKIRIPMN